MITAALVALNLACFGLELLMRDDLDAFLRRWGLVPADVVGPGADAPAAFVTLLTSMFLHAGWLHLGSNMLYLGVFGPPVERRLGGVRFLFLYLCCGIVGGVAYVLAQPTSTVPTIGASGAIAGLIAAQVVLFLHVVESAPTLLLLLIWLATQLFSGVASLTTSTGIAWWAHLGGFACGLALAPLFRPRHMRRS